MLAIRCAQLITPNQVISSALIVLDGSKVHACGPYHSVDLPAGTRVLDASTLTAVPGFVDWQLNGGFGCDFSSHPETIWQVGAQLPAHGVTAFLPTIITSATEAYAAAQDVMRAGPPAGYRGAEPLGLHFEGPFLNPRKKGAHDPAYLRLPDTELISSWTRKEHVWLVTMAPELPGAFEVAQTLHSNGVVVSAGHSMASYDGALSAFQHGFGAGTHLFNAMPPLDHRSPGLTAALLGSAQVMTGIIPDGVHVHPAMVNLAWKAKGVNEMTIVTDAVSALGMPPGEYVLGEELVIVDETSVRLRDGTLAGSKLRMDEAVRNLMAFTGCSLREAVCTASRNPAHLLKAAHKGRIQPNADADLLLLDKDQRPVCTIIRGEVVWGKV